MMIVKFNGHECKVEFDQYHNGNTAVILVDKNTGELVTVATANSDLHISKYVVGIKTWSENQGITRSLIHGGIIEEELLTIEPTGFVAIEYYLLTKQARKELEKIAI